jgi:hypothetical protein
MQKQILVLMTSAFLLACGGAAASAQQGPPAQQPAQTQQQQRPQGAQSPRQDLDQDDSDITGWHYGAGWAHHWDRADRGYGMMRRGGMRESMHSGMMMRMLFAMMDGDGDGAVSLQEFQAAHERIFKAMDANKDGVLTLEEIHAFMRGPRMLAPRQ